MRQQLMLYSVGGLSCVAAAAQRLSSETNSITPRTRKDDPLVIYYASMSGTAQGFAEDLEKRLTARGVKCVVRDIVNFSPAGIGREQRLAFVASTHEGGPPDSAKKFWSWMKGGEGEVRAEEVGWAEKEVAVFGLGDSRYPKAFMFSLDLLDELRGRGAILMCEPGWGDDHQGNPEKAFRHWSEEGLLPVMLDL